MMVTTHIPQYPAVIFQQLDQLTATHVLKHPLLEEVYNDARNMAIPARAYLQDSLPKRAKECHDLIHEFNSSDAV